MKIRAERTDDHAAVRALNKAAFESPLESKLVDALREQAEPTISLVAEDEGVVVGHIMFSPVAHADDPKLRVIGLAPMAVSPDRQRLGIGSRLVEAGLAQCREMGFVAAIVLGHPEYYPRFGFLPSKDFGIVSKYEVPPEVFMAMELQPEALDDKKGRMVYHPAFDMFDE
jgi:putative acetyltransferase